ncbi:MAG: NnrS family protein [Afipia sp.]|nr:NnrS family protein [Afipia sp.]OJW59763.1 MAG: short-chain dehydrogenase [Afipia sp. 64-13]
MVLNHTPISRLGNYHGSAFLSYGFRPFFLFGALYAGLAIAIWLPVFMGDLSLRSAFAPRDWHVHEMLYGYLAAVIAGFLFTAIPNWTGHLPYRGKPLLVLVIVWALGRAAVTFSDAIGWSSAMLIDVAFLALIAASAGREVVAGRNWRNLKVVALVLLLLLCNVGFHIEAHVEGAADISIRAGIAVVIVLVSLIGGRIIPSFTRNWLVRENPGRLPIPFGRFDIVVVIVGALVLVGWSVRPAGVATAAACVIAAMLHAARLGRWAGDRTSRDPLLLILHIGYVFIPLGFLLAAAAALELAPASAGLHAWMAGGAGIMTLAVMTRASLSHTGQRLVASVATRGIYVAIVAAALLRVGAALTPDGQSALLYLAALAWCLAFFGFVTTFGSLLLWQTKRR